jgi:hypothetical protein
MRESRLQLRAGVRTLKVLAGALVASILAIHANPAQATTFSLNTQSLDSVIFGSAGNAGDYPPSTSINVSEGSVVSGVMQLNFLNLFLPSVDFVDTIYKFTSVTPFTAQLTLATGAITVPGGVQAVVELRSDTNALIAGPQSFTFTLTTGSITNRVCGVATGADLAGSPLAPSGAVTLVGSGCLPFSDTLFGVRLAGTMSPVPAPEPGTALLLTAGLAGLAGAGSRRRHSG